MAEAKAPNARPEETPKAYFLRRWNALKDDRTTWLQHWRELSDYVKPRRFRYLSDSQQGGRKLNDKIINATGTLALRTLKSGMQAGVTSPARPWFRLRTPDPELNELRSVKLWLHDAEARMRELFSRSNFYNVMPNVYGDLGLFATGAVMAVEDPIDDIRFYSNPPGSYVAGNSDRLDVDTFYRKISMTVQQIAQRFGPENMTQRTRELYEQAKYGERIDVIHAIEPNLSRDRSKADNRNMPFLSVYFEENAPNENTMLSVSGFQEKPFFVPRWEITGEDPYGSECPGMTALGDIKALQLMEKRKAQALDKLVDPPMKAPTSMQQNPLSLLPGDVTWYNEAEGAGGQGPSPLYEINPRLNELYQEIRETENRVQKSFYADLFLMLANDQRSNVTAREIEERHQEKLLMLGPVLEKIHDELLDPIIDRTFNIMLRRGLIPEPPPELQGMELRVEYISVLAQAQEMVGLGALERSLGFVGQMASFSPEVMDTIEADETVREYWAISGAPPNLLRGREEVSQLRQRRRQQEQAQQSLEMAQQAAETGRAMSETSVEGDNALARLTGGL